MALDTSVYSNTENDPNGGNVKNDEESTLVKTFDEEKCCKNKLQQVIREYLHTTNEPLHEYMTTTIATNLHLNESIEMVTLGISNLIQCTATHPPSQFYLRQIQRDLPHIIKAARSYATILSKVKTVYTRNTHFTSTVLNSHP